MTVPRIFLARTYEVNARFELSLQAARHIQVLRMQPGMSIILFDGLGHSCLVEIEHMGKVNVDVRVIECLPFYNKPSNTVHVVIGMPANERMDWLVEKATELGVDRITPVMTQRSVIRLAGERATKRLAHWQGIAQAACSQSGRYWLPDIDLPLTLHDFLDQFIVQQSQVNVLLSLSPAAKKWRDIWGVIPRHLTFINGPEGGLNADEELLAVRKGFIPTSLGTNILRSETAAIAVLCQLL
jgi:16S rRNA (uracil1498-N3)-methyltransferase